MTDAILIAMREIQNDHGRGPIDALAVSLSSEFLARAVTEAPLAFRSAALVSPTGFRSRDKNTKWRNGTREMPWLHAFFDFPLWSEGFFRLLTSRAGIRFFLNKTWGSRAIDEGLLEYDYLTTHQPGAQHAPYYFVSGFLFSEDITRIYHSLTLPVWMSHGVRGDFVDYSGKAQVEGRANWTIRVFETGAMPHFEAQCRVHCGLRCLSCRHAVGIAGIKCRRAGPRLGQGWRRLAQPGFQQLRRGCRIALARSANGREGRRCF